MPIVRRINIGESHLYRQLRLASLKDSPESFSTTYQAASRRTSQSWADQADGSAKGVDRAAFFAIDEDEPVGIAALYRDENDRSVGELIQVWVSPEHRGSGLATRLIRHIIEWASQNGFAHIHTEVLDTNKRAIRFYERAGFEISDSKPSDSIACVVLKRRL